MEASFQDTSCQAGESRSESDLDQKLHTEANLSGLKAVGLFNVAFFFLFFNEKLKTHKQGNKVKLNQAQLCTFQQFSLLSVEHSSINIAISVKMNFNTCCTVHINIEKYMLSAV